MKTIEIDIQENGKVYNLLIGQNQLENDKIIRMCDQNDLWFHLDKTSGPHFILRNGGDEIPKRYINYICGLFSEYKNGLPNRYSVIYTQLKNVKLTEIPGKVITCKTKTVIV